MTRLSFTPLMRDLILAGRKTGTTRKFTREHRKGSQVAAVCPEPGKPGFLIPAEQRFATLKITGNHTVVPARVAWRIYCMEGFDSEQEYLNYLALINPNLSPLIECTFLEFEVLDHGLAKGEEKDV